MIAGKITAILEYEGKSNLYDDSEKRTQVITYDLWTNTKEKAVVPVDKYFMQKRK